MRFLLLLTLQATWLTVCQATQHYPTTWGHYDLCKSHGYTDEGPTWYYMACQPEAADMTKYLKVFLDPPNITCGDPPETYCTLVSEWIIRFHPQCIYYLLWFHLILYNLLMCFTFDMQIYSWCRMQTITEVKQFWGCGMDLRNLQPVVTEILTNNWQSQFHSFMPL